MRNIPEIKEYPFKDSMLEAEEHNWFYKNSVQNLNSVEDLKNRVVYMRYPQQMYYLGYFDNNGVYQIAERRPWDIITTKVNEREIVASFLLDNGQDKIQYLVSHSTGHRLNKRPVPKEIYRINGIRLNRSYANWVLRTLVPKESTISDFVERYNWLIDQDVCDELSDLLFDRYGLYIIQGADGQPSATDNILKEADISNEVKSFVYNIERPHFERASGNKNTKTFDFIRVFISVASEEKYPNRLSFVNEHREELGQLALMRIQNMKSFTKYGVPINFLKLDSAVIMQSDQLMFLFSLKTEGRDEYE